MSFYNVRPTAGSSDGSTIETEYADVSINDSDSSAIFFICSFILVSPRM